MSHSARPPSGDPDRYALRIVGIKEDEVRHVRMLGRDYGGCMTHWARGRTVWCEGDACKLPAHRTGGNWKGYTCAEVWDEKHKVWAPIAFEITESLELDFRGRFQRGQVWRCERIKVDPKKHPPVRGFLEETADERELVEPFDILPCVRSAYHAMDLVLNVKNPLPPRVIVSARPGKAPASLAQEAPAAVSAWRNDPEEVNRLAAIAEACLGPTMGRNGRH